MSATDYNWYKRQRIALHSADHPSAYPMSLTVDAKDFWTSQMMLRCDIDRRRLARGAVLRGALCAATCLVTLLAS